MEAKEKSIDNKVFSEMIRYAFVSVVALVVDAGGLVVLKNMGMNVVLAATVSFTAGLVVNFIMSRKWAFNGKPTVSSRAEFIVFAIIGITGLGLTDLIIWICTSQFKLYYLLAKGISVVTVFFWNFLLRKYLIYTNKTDNKKETD